ncbi:ryanodine receptor 2 [Planomicrobium sp. HSC-17F08]|nr:ryanodine receptor 2 [Planomicrobium sp. HSC-17F08]
MSYKPSPIDTKDISLSEELKQLTETLAESTHDVWAQRRIDEGWVYGKERNDVLKTHPGLLPYNELVESEKEYDRSTAMETLKAIIALGYSIEKKEKNY